MRKSRYCINTKLINQVMTEQGIDINYLTDGTNISDKQIKRFLQGIIPRRQSLEISLIFRLKLGIKFEDMILEKPITE